MAASPAGDLARRLGMRGRPVVGPDHRRGLQRAAVRRRDRRGRGLVLHTFGVTEPDFAGRHNLAVDILAVLGSIALVVATVRFPRIRVRAAS